MESRSDYPENVIADLEALASSGRRRKDRGYGFTIMARPELGPLLKEAAKARGCTTTTYARRAVAAFIAHDLGLPLKQVMAHFPAAVDHGMRNTITLGRNERSHDDGEGYGRWHIELV